MNRRLAIVWVASLLGIAAGLNASEPARERGASLSDLRVAAMPTKKVYLRGEPVFLRVILSNVSASSVFEVKGPWHLADDFDIRVAPAREFPKRYLAGEKGGQYRPSITIILPPREVRVQQWALCYEPENRSGFLFEKAGDYTIECSARRLKINDAPRNLTFSKTPIQIKIVEPPASEMEVLDLILSKGRECAEDLQNIQGGRVRSDTSEIWQAIADRYPKSVWAPYAKMLLAWRERKVGDPDPKAVARRLNEILEEYPGFALRDAAYYVIARCHDEMGEPMQTLDWLYRLRREYPASHYLRANREMFRKYLYPKGWERRYDPQGGGYDPWYMRQ